MKISVVYANPEKPTMLNLEVPEGTKVGDAIYRSGIIERFPEIDLSQQKVGVFGKFVTLEAALEDGARIEIYRSITADPATIRRREVAKPAAKKPG